MLHVSIKHAVGGYLVRLLHHARKDSEVIGFGDRHFYDEVGRPIGDRKIIPMVHLPDLTEDAMAVYRDWTDKHGGD